MKREHSAPTLFVLLLFLVFALCILLVLLLGAQVYGDMRKDMEQLYEQRTCLSYLETKLRHYDQTGAIETTSLFGQSALRLSEEIDGTPYDTYLYCDGENLLELFLERGVEPTPDFGQPVLNVEALLFRWTDKDLLRIDCTDGGGVQTLYFCRRSAEAAS